MRNSQCYGPSPVLIHLSFGGRLLVSLLWSIPPAATGVAVLKCTWGFGKQMKISLFWRINKSKHKTLSILYYVHASVMCMSRLELTHPFDTYLHISLRVL